MPSLSLFSFPSPSTGPNFSTSLGYGDDILSAVLPEGGKKTILEGYSSTGFDANDVHILGSVVALGEVIYGINLDASKDEIEIPAELLKVLSHLSPPLDLLFFGSHFPLGKEVRNEVTEWGRKEGIRVEFGGVGNVMATFNILNGEERRVGAVLVNNSQQGQ